MTLFLEGVLGVVSSIREVTLFEGCLVFERIRYSRDSRQKIPGNTGMKKCRESREFPVPGIPGVKLYSKVLEFSFKNSPVKM